MKNPYIKINDRFSIGADAYNWILKDNTRKTERQNGYFATVEQLIKSLRDKYRKEALAMASVGVDQEVRHIPLSYPLESIIMAQINTYVYDKLAVIKQEMREAELIMEEEEWEE